MARAWRLQRGVTNGARQLRHAARRAQAEVDGLCQHDPRARRLALELTALLEAVVRTSSAVECINSLLAHFLWTKRSFPDRHSAQRFLYLLMKPAAGYPTAVLWGGKRPARQG